MPLFEAYAPRMVKELETANIVSFDHAENVNDQLWNWLSTENRSGSMGRRVALNRFGAGCYAAKKGQGLWSKREFERTALCIENDLVTANVASKIVVKPGDDEAGSEGGSTNPKLV